MVPSLHGRNQALNLPCRGVTELRGLIQLCSDSAKHCILIHVQPKKKEQKIHVHLGKDTYSTVLLHVSLLSLTACRQGLESC